MTRKLSIYTDGASRNNPGEAAIGVVIKNEGKEIVETLSQSIGIATNNVAEYTALIQALKAAQKLNPEQIDFYLDSQLVVRQITGEYKIKNAGLVPLVREAHDLIRRFPKGRVNFHHIPREENKEADALANAALDKKNKKL